MRRRPARIGKRILKDSRAWRYSPAGTRSALGIGALSAMRFRPVAAANGDAELHGMSVFGDLKYPADFHHFDYVNPAAPEGRHVFADPVDPRL